MIMLLIGWARPFLSKFNLPIDFVMAWLWKEFVVSSRWIFLKHETLVEVEA